MDELGQDIAAAAGEHTELGLVAVGLISMRLAVFPKRTPQLQVLDLYQRKGNLPGTRESLGYLTGTHASEKGLSMGFSQVPRIELSRDGTVTLFVNVGGFRVGAPVEISGYATQTNGAVATFREVQRMPAGDPVEGVIMVVRGVPVIGSAFTADEPIMVIAQAAYTWINKLDSDTGEQALPKEIMTTKALSGQVNVQTAWNSDEQTSYSVWTADRAPDPVSNGLSHRMTQIQEEFTRGLRATLEEVIGESVLGPALTNFTGYLTLELHHASEEDPLVGSAQGTIRTGPGHELVLVMSVIRKPAAAGAASLSQGPDNSFLVLEPIVIEGGRDAPVAEFDAVVDCATLTPLPRRQNLSVTERASTPFRFKLPDRHGQHELWFQLYQAGRLIQAVAISVEVRPEQMAAK